MQSIMTQVKQLYFTMRAHIYGYYTSYGAFATFPRCVKATQVLLRTKTALFSLLVASPCSELTVDDCATPVSYFFLSARLLRSLVTAAAERLSLRQRLAPPSGHILS